jgi:hypothetical protein
MPDAFEIPERQGHAGEDRVGFVPSMGPPGEKAVIHATVGNNRPEYATAKCIVEVDGRKVCSSDCSSRSLPDQFSPDYVDEVPSPSCRTPGRGSGEGIPDRPVLPFGKGFVTGGTCGIGRAISLHFARQELT